MTSSIFVAQGRYHLIRLLGEGGAATVFLAEDTTLDVQRAIKALSPRLASSAAHRRRLIAEAKLMAKLIHPHIVTVHDVVDEEVPFIVMEFLKGGSLSQYIAHHGPLSIDQAVSVMLPICHALHAAHELGVVHLDIKPQNILLTDAGIPKLTDFGIARALIEVEDEQPKHMVGTPSYMAPEQRLRQQKIGVQSDVYSLGATFYVVLTGQNPDQMFDPDIQSARFDQLPEPVQSFLKSCCAFQEEKRPKSALEVANALTPLMSETVHLLPKVHSDHEHDASLLHDAWHKLSNDQSDKGKHAPQKQQPLRLEVEQDTLDQMVSFQSVPAPPLADETDELPSEASDTSEFRLEDVGPINPETNDLSAKQSTVTSQRQDEVMDNKVVQGGQSADNKADRKPSALWRFVGIGILCAIALGGSILGRLDTQWTLPIYVLSLGGLIAISAGFVLGQPVFRKRSRVLELGHSLIAVLAVAIGGAFVSAPLLLEMSFFETDFIDYCVGIVHFDTVLLAPPKRANGAAWLPAMLARDYGVINGLALGALLSTGLIGLGIQLWARAIGGPMAGYFAVAMALGLAPIVGMSRFLNFYPEIIATFVMAAGMTALALRTRHAGFVLAAGVLACSCVIVDLRGLIWFLPLTLGVLLAVFGIATWRDRLSTLCGLIGIYFGAWKLGSWSYHELATSLERQIDVRPLFAAFDSTQFSPPYAVPSNFVWGRSDLTELPKTLAFLFEQRTIPPPDGFLSADTGMDILAPYAVGWTVLLGVGLLMALALYSSKRWQMLALLVPLSPFAVAMIGTQELVEPHLRFFAHAIPGAVVLVAVVMSGLMRQVQLSCASHRSHFGFRTVVVGLLFALLWGGMLRPLVNWHPRWPIQRHIYRSALEKAFPERAGYFRTMQVSVGIENHVHVLPLSQAERSLAQNYDLECAARLKADQVFVPWLYDRSHQNRR
ncbi:MAG: serine/threonine-protein kinase [Myxococcota bacterium]|nr:serine/threonine-protein kinase [Myxococcota bacterium]